MRALTVAAAAAATATSLVLPLHGAASADVPVTAPAVRSYIVVLKDGSAAGAVATGHDRRFGASVERVYHSALQGYSARMTAAEAARVAADGRVQLVQPDTRLHLLRRPPGAPGGGRGHNQVTPLAQVLPTGVNRVEADASPTARIDGSDERVDVDVAVIDTGIDFDHPDLNVYTDGAQNCSSASSADDDNGHGTHVAGTIGALDNSTGVVGVAPGARVWPVKVLNAGGSGTLSEVICGIDYVTAHADEIEVANMSLGGGGADDGNCGKSIGDAMHEAICNSVDAGVTYVVAAGNAASDAADSIPASYDEVITVSALADFNGEAGGGADSTCRPDQDDTFADFSNHGGDVDLIGPGVCINSTWLDGGYNTISGTSMASPHVAGGAALYAATHTAATPDQVKTALQDGGSTDWDNGDDVDGVQENLLGVGGF